jgi:hypothetical protein
MANLLVIFTICVILKSLSGKDFNNFFVLEHISKNDQDIPSGIYVGSGDSASDENGICGITEELPCESIPFGFIRSKGLKRCFFFIFLFSISIL